MIVKFKKVRKIGKNQYCIKTDKGIMYYHGILHDKLEGKDVDITVEERVNVRERAKHLVIVDYKFEILPEGLKKPPTIDEQKEEIRQGQIRDLEGTFLRDILVSPLLAKAKGNPVKTAQKWAKAHAEWVFREVR